MKTKTIFIGVSVFLYASFSISIASAETPNIIISEIQIQGDTANDEFIELYNAGDKEQDLKDFKLATVNISDNSIKDLIKSFLRTPFILGPNQYYLWANSNGEFGSFADASTTGSLTKGNTFGLFYKNILQNSFSWNENPRPNMSAFRNSPSSVWDFTNTTTPTNSKGEVYKKRIPCSEKSSENSVYLNEIFPNPKNENDEFIELYNATNGKILLKSWKIKDKVKIYPFSDAAAIDAKDYLILKKSQTGIELNNSNEQITLLDENGKIEDEVCYENTKEDVSLNHTNSGWRGGTPTPGVANQLNNLPETTERVPKKGYHGVEVDFDAQGKDTDHDTLHYTWDFGDGHKSYKEQTTHTYEENGTYTVTLKTSDDKEDVLETFTIKIESFPHPKVHIVSFVPNPAGSDTDNEWIIIENQEKKTINLKGYSIATGWKTLSNHPIREDFLIKPKSEARLTRAFSLFSLPNQKGKIELRAPDRKTLQDIKYKFEKSIAEDAVYQKEKGAPWKLVTSAPKNIPATTPAKNIEVIPPQTEPAPLPIPEEDKPEENNPASENQISLDPDRPKPQEILAYGTRAHLSDAITLTTLTMEETSSIIETTSSSRKSLFSQINASLNEALNNLHQ